MDLSSPQFWLFMGIAALVVWIRMRKAKRPPKSRGRQITIRGNRITTELQLSTPLVCLLDEGKIFGTDHKVKNPPELPHEEGCKCSILETSENMDQHFEGKETKESFQSDLGELTHSQMRYYKYYLIANKQEISDDKATSYLELAKEMDMSEEFKQKVESHLN